MNRPMIYYSHPIAGKYGPEAKNYDHEEKNCGIAIQNVLWLRTAFPQVDWYCPGEVEMPIQTARKLGHLTTEQVLDIDFYIMKNKCCAGLAHPWETSRGVEKEKEKFENFNYPYRRIHGPTEIWNCDYVTMQMLVQEVLASHK